MLETVERPAAVRTGRLIVVVGPSGAGKDTLIDYARARLADEAAVLFVRRVVTRAPNPAAEDHDGLSIPDFAAAEHAGAFAVTWDAHGLRYGLPSLARKHVQAGGVAIANGSRAALPAIRTRFAEVAVVHVTATPAVLSKRLAARGREDAAEIEKRLLRAGLDIAEDAQTFRIDNSNELSEAGEAFLAIVSGLLAR